MRKIISAVMAIAIILSLSCTAFAYDGGNAYLDELVWSDNGDGTYRTNPNLTEGKDAYGDMLNWLAELESQGTLPGDIPNDEPYAATEEPSVESNPADNNVWKQGTLNSGDTQNNVGGGGYIPPTTNGNNSFRKGDTVPETTPEASPKAENGAQVQPGTTQVQPSVTEQPGIEELPSGNFTWTQGNLDANTKTETKTETSNVADGNIPATNNNVTTKYVADYADTVINFTDVAATAWYVPYVKATYALGLFSGTSNTTFDPQGTLTYAQAITLAARTYANANGETVPTSADGEAWYQGAYDYCVANGIIDGTTYKTVLNENASRYEMVAILDKAVSANTFSIVRDIDSVIDVPSDSPYAATVLSWYRAGIVSGTGTGAFEGERSITRAEVAKIMCSLNGVI